VRRFAVRERTTPKLTEPQPTDQLVPSQSPSRHDPGRMSDGILVAPPPPCTVCDDLGARLDASSQDCGEAPKSGGYRSGMLMDR
jgi:hypothetical protein